MVTSAIILNIDGIPKLVDVNAQTDAYLILPNLIVSVYGLLENVTNNCNLQKQLVNVTA